MSFVLSVFDCVKSSVVSHLTSDLWEWNLLLAKLDSVLDLDRTAEI